MFPHLLIALLVCSLTAKTVTADCSITMPTDMPKSEPVLLFSKDGSASYTLFKPTGQVTNLPIGAKLLLLCTGNGNVIESLDQESLELFCRAGNVFKSATGTQYTLNQLGCKSIPTSTLQLTAEPCADNRGFIYNAGFAFNTNQFASLFNICYENVTENAFYTQHMINGAAIKYNVQESTRRAFRADGMKSTTTATNTFYTINNGIARFEKYFGKAQTYVDKAMYLARGHLTPDADFVFGYEQLATYFYANVAPEFQIINAGNWIRVENTARSLAASIGDDVDIYNGYMGILQLPKGKSGQLVSIYLDTNDKIEVPKYYFKVIKHKSTDAAVVMVTLNNPFATESDVDEFCGNVCDRAGVNSPYFTDRTRGYTFCCELAEFKKHYGDLPKNLTASKLLNENSDRVKNSEDVEVADEVELPPLPSAKSVATTKTGCTITMPTDLPNPEPVYVVYGAADSAKPQLFHPTGEVTTLTVDSKLTLYCAGRGNTFSDVDQQTLTLTCQQDGSFYSADNSKTYKLNQLGCTKIPTADLLLTSTKCSNNQGYLYEAGFTLDSDFVSSFTLCYDNVTEHTLYARSIINGAAQNFKINESTRRAFRADGMRFTTTAANNFYTNKYQVARFEKYFGKAQEYISSSSFFARGHLAPDADFIFGYEQLATYYYANAAPEFQVVNAGNWIRVENAARSLAAQYGSDLLTFTSTLGQLQLPTKANKLQSIYLDDEEKFVKAPMWYYKVLMHPKLPKDLVMITLNNPFADIAEVKEFCTNVCDAYGLNSPFFTDTSRGYTFCCTLVDFQKAVADLPKFDVPVGWSA